MLYPGNSKVKLIILIFGISQTLFINTILPCRKETVCFKKAKPEDSRRIIGFFSPGVENCAC
jgi:hypothetical protein